MAEKKMTKAAFIKQTKNKLSEMKVSDRRSYLRGILAVNGDPKITKDIRALYDEHIKEQRENSS